MYCDGDMISSSNNLKVVTINEDMPLNVLRKIIMDVIRGYKILLDLFYCQPIYIGDDCV